MEVRGFIVEWILFASHHDTASFAMCLKFATDVETEAHLIEPVIEESISIVQAKKQLQEDLGNWAIKNKINASIDISLYNALLPRTELFDLANYLTLLYAVYLDIKIREKYGRTMK